MEQAVESSPKNASKEALSVRLLDWQCLSDQDVENLLGSKFVREIESSLQVGTCGKTRWHFVK